MSWLRRLSHIQYENRTNRINKTMEFYHRIKDPNSTEAYRLQLAIKENKPLQIYSKGNFIQPYGSETHGLDKDEFASLYENIDVLNGLLYQNDEPIFFYRDKFSYRHPGSMFNPKGGHWSSIDTIMVAVKEQ